MDATEIRLSVAAAAAAASASLTADELELDVGLLKVVGLLLPAKELIFYVYLLGTSYKVIYNTEFCQILFQLFYEILNISTHIKKKEYNLRISSSRSTKIMCLQIWFEKTSIFLKRQEN